MGDRHSYLMSNNMAGSRIVDRARVALLRGGPMTKIAGQAANFVPGPGVVLGGLVFATTALMPVKTAFAAQEQVFAYSGVQTALRDEMETLWQRVGHRGRVLNRDSSVSASGSGFWLRGVYSDVSADGKTSVGGVANKTGVEYNESDVQIGYDQELLNERSTTLIAGIFGHYKHLDLTVDDSTGTRMAEADADGYGGGVSVSWKRSTGLADFYSDLIGQITMWDAKGAGSIAGSGSGSFDVMAYSGSIEGGLRFSLDESVRLVPQAQLAWRYSDYDKFKDSNGVDIRWKEQDSLTGRIGIALEGGKPVYQGGYGLAGYVIANLVYDFTDAGSLLANGAKVQTETTRTKLEGRVGVNLADDDDGWTFFAEGGVATSITGKNYTGVKGVLGARWNF